MAKLTQRQVDSRIRKEKEKQDALKKKREIQEKKAIFGENWRQVEQQTIQKELEAELGSEVTPKIYDSKDLYDFFEPINFYTDRDNKRLELDYDNFVASEEKFQQALDDIDRELQSLKEKEPEEKLTKEEKELAKQAALKQEIEDYKKMIANDGVDETPLVLDGVDQNKDNKKSSKEDKDEIEDEVEDGNGKSIIDGSANVIDKAKAINKMKFAPANFSKKQLRDREKMLATISSYLNRFTPLYNKHICTCCGTPKDISAYYITSNIMCSNRIDNKGNLHMYVCKECCNKLLAYYYSVLCDKNLELAMQRLCATLNMYWDVDVFYSAKQKYEDGDRQGTLIGCYVIALTNDFIGKTFSDSPILQKGYKASKEHREKTPITEAPFDWSKEDARNKKDVIKILGYDPFSYEENEEEKKILYADVVSVIDEDVQQDYVKMQSALTIVKSFNKVRKLDEKAHMLEKNNAPLTEQKAIADLKAKELKAISDFSRDSGFSERFKSRQNQGQTSFTGIVKAMNEKQYENELINKYDIQTSSTIQAAADASFKAIFNQLNLSDAEVYKIVQEQLGELRKLRQENDRLREDLRLSRYQCTELRLKEKARAQGKEVDDEDDYGGDEG